jgi:hypothetical protein
MYEFPKPDDELFRDDQPERTNNAVLSYNFKQFPLYADGVSKNTNNDYGYHS